MRFEVGDLVVFKSDVRLEPFYIPDILKVSYVSVMGFVNVRKLNGVLIFPPLGAERFNPGRFRKIKICS